jgi:hypothetical protein
MVEMVALAIAEVEAGTAAAYGLLLERHEILDQVVLVEMDMRW